ncbi:MAG: hypothetical protein B6I20_01210 [Bacteroidetes bacterium 4572_117]|nr:MAG: hypothetical protein B6I20_01210 [Bacteroidetes bacterium 4572_117]
MKKKLIILTIITSLLIVGYFYVVRDYEKAESTVYINGNIITLENQQPTAQAMLVEDGIIEAIGTNEEIAMLKPEQIKTVNLKGSTILPGFIDVHTHVALSTFLAEMVDLSGFKHKTAQEVWNYFEKAVKEAKPGEWIVCKGIDHILVEDLNSPTLAYLDKVAAKNPVVMLSQSLHTYWANSKAFEKVGITAETKNPSKSSYYERDEKGRLTGLIVEQEAFAPFIDQLKKDLITPKSLMNSTTKVLKDYTKNGNTTVVSAGITVKDAKPLRLYEHLSTNNPSFLNKLLAKFGFLPDRIQYPRHFIYIRYDTPFLLPEKKDEANDFYDIIGIKHWYDGSPYAGSMYINEPYIVSDFTQHELHLPEGHRGKSLIKPEDLKSFIKKYNAMGWQIAIHAQGDAAIEEILQAYTEVNKEQSVSGLRHRIEHCLLLPDSSINKMKTLNISPSFHINHLYYYGKALKHSVIGEERAEKILQIGTTKNKQITYSLHADQPMFESKAFRLIQTAVERQTKEGDTLGYNQRITVLEGIKAMTINAAWQIHKENKIGSLKKGKYADFLVLDKNPLEIPTKDLENIKILKTYINGNEAK